MCLCVRYDDGKNQQTISKKHITTVRRLNTIRMEMKVANVSTMPEGLQICKDTPLCIYTYKMNCGASRHYTFSHVRRCVALSTVLYLKGGLHLKNFDAKFHYAVRIRFMCCISVEVNNNDGNSLFAVTEYVVDAE